MSAHGTYRTCRRHSTDVLFWGKGGHNEDPPQCPLWVKSGLMHCSKTVAIPSPHRVASSSGGILMPSVLLALGLIRDWRGWWRRRWLFVCCILRGQDRRGWWRRWRLLARSIFPGWNWPGLYRGRRLFVWSILLGTRPRAQVLEIQAA